MSSTENSGKSRSIVMGRDLAAKRRSTAAIFCSADRTYSARRQSAVVGAHRTAGNHTSQRRGIMRPYTKAASDSKPNSKSRKPPGIRAKETGPRLKQGAALQVVAYPRANTKAVLVDAARRTGFSVSSFLLIAGLEKAAGLRDCQVADLVPRDELRRYV